MGQEGLPHSLNASLRKDHQLDNKESTRINFKALSSLQI